MEDIFKVFNIDPNINENIIKFIDENKDKLKELKESSNFGESIVNILANAYENIYQDYYLTMHIFIRHYIIYQLADSKTVKDDIYPILCGCVEDIKNYINIFNNTDFLNDVTDERIKIIISSEMINIKIIKFGNTYSNDLNIDLSDLNEDIFKDIDEINRFMTKIEMEE